MLPITLRKFSFTDKDVLFFLEHTLEKKVAVSIDVFSDEYAINEKIEEYKNDKDELETNYNSYYNAVLSYSKHLKTYSKGTGALEKEVENLVNYVGDHGKRLCISTQLNVYEKMLEDIRALDSNVPVYMEFKSLEPDSNMLLSIGEYTYSIDKFKIVKVIGNVGWALTSYREHIVM